jgi:Ca2+-binding RTX toxin-like protein
VLRNIENVQGSTFNDRISGDNGPNHLMGEAGNDFLSGRGGDDTIDGGVGVDIVSYRFSGSTGVSFTSTFKTAGTPSSTQSDGSGGTDTLISVEELEFIGADGNDTFVGGLENNYAWGGSGNDSLAGGAGHDALRGQGGNDSLDGGEEDDFLVGGFGDDTLIGGAGIDRAGNYQTDSVAGGVTIDLRITAAQQTGQGLDVYSGIEQLSGTPFADSFTGNDLDNWLWGSGSQISSISPDPVTGEFTFTASTNNNDKLDGQGGNDLLSVGGGNHTVIGGAGVDTLSYGENGAPEVGIKVTITAGPQNTGAGIWSLAGIENLSGGTLNDELTGDGGANLLAGGRGNDTLSGADGDDALYGDGQMNADTFSEGRTGGAGPIRLFEQILSSTTGLPLGGADLLNGGAGNDTLRGGAGNDSVEGGAGVDTARFTGAKADYDISINASGVVTVSDKTANRDGVDMLTGVEKLQFSDVTVDAPITGSPGQYITGTDGNDNNLNGGDGPDTISGLKGDDFINPFGGNDSVLAGEGNDYIQLGSGQADNDTVDGGLGNDVVSYGFWGTPVNFVSTLLSGTQSDYRGGVDTLIEVEELHAFGTDGNDTFVGGMERNYLGGNGGNDVLTGGGGNDTFSFSVNGPQGQDTITDFSTADDLHFSNNSGAGNTFSITGLSTGTTAPASLNAGQVMVVTGADHTMLYVGTGNSTQPVLSVRLNGTFQAQAFTFQNNDWGAQIRYTPGQTINGTDSNDNNLNGGDGPDTISGLKGDDFINPFGGNDSVLAGEGNDYIQLGSGQADNDTVDGGFGDDVVSYGFWGTPVNFVSTLLSGTQSDYRGGVDTLIDVEELHAFGTDGNDTFVGGMERNYFGGNGGNDVLTGGGGNDTFSFSMNGPQGQDTITDFSAADDLHFNNNSGAGNTFSINGLGTGTTAPASLNEGQVMVVTGADHTMLHVGTGNSTQPVLAIRLDGSFQAEAFVFQNHSWGAQIRYAPVSAPAGQTITGDGGNNQLSGGDGPDTISGMGGNDGLTGGLGNDSLLGGDGDDYFNAGGLPSGGGNDTIDGGANGSFGDTVDYGGSTSGVQVDLQSGVAQDGTGGTDTLQNVEHVTGTGSNDTLLGSNVTNWFRPGGGNDSVDGRGGRDVVMYEGASAGAVINLKSGTATGTAIGADTLVSIEAVHGTHHPDTITLADGGGYVFARAGADTVTGGSGDDNLYAGSGADSVDGGAGFDTINYRDDGFDNGTSATSTLGVSVNLKTGTATDNWGDTDTLKSIELVWGSRFNDSLVGGDTVNGALQTDGFEGFRGEEGNDTIDGGTGFDRVYYDNSPVGVTVQLGGSGAGTAQDGWGGTDTLISIEEVRASPFADVLTGTDEGFFESFEGRGGNDTIDGKGGTDRVNYQTSPNGVNVSLATATGTAQDGWGGTDSLMGIEQIRGSEFGDTLSGSAGANSIEGRGGNDSISGGDSSDTLTGGGGDDTLDGGAQRLLPNPSDTANVSNEFDFAIYSDATGGVTVTLGADGQSGSATGAGVGTDVLRNIEFVIGSRFDDQITGSNRIGVEIFRGGAGNDTIRGGDTMAGVDQGFNYVDYRDAASAVTVNLLNGSASGGDGNDVLFGIQGVNGSMHADTLLGDGADNFFDGRTGNDSIDGGAGQDWVLYTNAAGSVNVNLGGGSASGADGNDTLVSIENVRGSAFGDTLTGSDGANDFQAREGNDTVMGLEGNDTIHGGMGNDSIDGGTGVDTARFTGAKADYDISVNASGMVTVSDKTVNRDGVDTLTGVEKLQFGDESVEVAAISNQAPVAASASVTMQEDGVLSGSLPPATDADADTVTYASSSNPAHGSVTVQSDGSYSYTPAANFSGSDSFGFSVSDGRGGSNSYLVSIQINAVNDAPAGTVTMSGDTRHGQTLQAGVTGLSDADGLGTFSYQWKLGGVVVSGATSSTFSLTESMIGQSVSLTVSYTDGGGTSENTTSASATVLAQLGQVKNGSAAAESLTGGSGPDTISGLAGNDTLIGGGGADTLDGGVGADSMTGGDGSDTFVVDDAGDVTSEGAGQAGDVDTVLSSVNRTLSTNVENLVLTDAATTGSGNAAANRIEGNELANSLLGVGGDDTLVGHAGNDTLNGGAGADRMEGGAGDDVYTVDNAADVIVELAGQGTDRVSSSVNYTLAPHVENLTLSGTASSGTGNELANVITAAAGVSSTLSGGTGNDSLSGSTAADSLAGGDGADTLNGGAGADTMLGGMGDDTYYVDDALDVTTETSSLGGVDTVISSVTRGLGTALEHLVLTGTALNGTGNASANRMEGNAGANSLFGGAGDDTLLGGGGNDTLNGSTGADQMEGGAGNDLYTVDSAADVVVEQASQGTDRVSSSVSFMLGANVENLTLTGTAANGTGNELANYITGNTAANSLVGGAGADTLIGDAGADTVDGGEGADVLQGGTGNDVYIVDNAADQTVESSALAGEIDTIISSVNRTMSTNIENLVLTGPATTGSGNAANNRIEGNELANSLLGVEGADTLVGNAGNDTLNGGAGADRMEGGTGNDVYAVDNVGDVVVEAADQGTDRVSSSVSYTLGGHVENLTLSGTGAISGTGNELANTITGNAGANLISGAAGADTLSGGDGADTLIGGAGADRLSGGAGADVFSYLLRSDGGDTITDFVSGTDKIRVSAAAWGLTQNQAVSLLINQQPTTAAATFLYSTATGELWFDPDGNGVLQVELIAVLTNKPSLAPGDIGVGP